MAEQRREPSGAVAAVHREVSEYALAPRQSRVRMLARRILRRHPTMVIAMGVVLLMVLIAIFAPYFRTTDPKYIDTDFRLMAPNSVDWFGTDKFGRDVWSRTLFGSRISLIVGGSVSALVSISASLIGLVTGYFRRLDMVIMRIMDGMMAIPTILLAIALVSITGSSVQNVILALSVVSAPRGVRLVRSTVLALAEEEYVEAARATGAGTARILLLHIFPGTLPALIVLSSLILAGAILVEAILSFLGAGTPVETPSWGNMMAEGRKNLSLAIWVVGFPGMFLTATVLAVNVIGDNLRDLLDPKLSRAG